MTTDTKKSSSSESSAENNKAKLNKLFNESADVTDVPQDDIAKDVPEDSSVEDLKLLVQSLKQELAEEKETHLRTQADLQNRLKRKDNDKEAALKFAQEKFFKDFLLVLDSIDGALLQDSATATVEHYQEGLSMMSNQLQSLLSQFKVEEIVPEVGSSFSPANSEAMSMQPNEQYPHNSVLLVVQKGYTYQGRLIRPARVIVSQNLDSKDLESSHSNPK